MKKTAKRALSICLALSLYLGMMLMSIHAEGVKKTVTTEAGDSYTLTAAKEAVGETLTVTAAGLPEDGSWSFNIHISKDGEDRYSMVGPEGQTPFVTLDEAFQYVEAARMTTGRGRSFVLTVPEEYQDWTIAIRIVNQNGTAVEIPLKLEGTVEEQPVEVNFSDVAESDWFQPYVAKIVGAGWMSGMGEGQFAPNGPLTVAQVLVMASKIHSSTFGKEIARAEGEWYAPYYNYCVAEGLIAGGQYTDMNRAATRFEMVEILDKAAHESRTNRGVNDVDDGFIPDLAEGDEHGEVVYRWYRSGLITGGSDHSFNGASTITRAEASVILCRLLLLVDFATI